MEIDRREFFTGLAVTATAPKLPAINTAAASLPVLLTTAIFERLGLVDAEQQQRAIVLARRSLRACVKELRAREGPEIARVMADFSRAS
jgi:hypothetical protein